MDQGGSGWIRAISSVTFRKRRLRTVQKHTGFCLDTLEPRAWARGNRSLFIIKKGNGDSLAAGDPGTEGLPLPGGAF